MKKLLLAACIVATTMSMAVSEAEAARLGRSGSVGRQSQGVTRQSAAPAQPQQAARPAAAPTTPAGVPAKPASPWRGMLGGALLGLGLGAMLSHFGMGGALGSMISTLLMVALLAFAVMFIVRMFRRKNDDANKPAYASVGGGAYGGTEPGMARTPEIGSRLDRTGETERPALGAAGGAAAFATSAAPWGVPADFDVPGFLRQAKTYFIRLQADWDKADIADLREFTTAEMFAELRLQIQERGASPNTTDVVSLENELLGIETTAHDYLASVKFSGLIKESPEVSAEPFAEVWNLSKPLSGGGWVLAGIQQLN
ncbi:MAG: putative rane protein [Herminiimonas sp.]|nr:putative rane protein [Herminiimonas sp.]MDB5853484.1 putative rane protein [Herminiimonas sp.]